MKGNYCLKKLEQIQKILNAPPGLLNNKALFFKYKAL